MKENAIIKHKVEMHKKIKYAKIIEMSDKILLGKLFLVIIALQRLSIK